MTLDNMIRQVRIHTTPGNVKFMFLQAVADELERLQAVEKGFNQAKQAFYEPNAKLMADVERLTNQRDALVLALEKITIIPHMGQDVYTMTALEIAKQAIDNVEKE